MASRFVGMRAVGLFAAPGQIVRVFVGRLEIVTPTIASAVKTALAHNDEETLKKYERFLEPILQTVKQEH
jgi:hypothetical protein